MPTDHRRPGECGLDLSHVAVDILSLRSASRRGVEPYVDEALRQATQALESDFLEGLDLRLGHRAPEPGAPGSAKRRAGYASNSTALVARLEGVPDEALPHARTLSLLEPADEAVQATLVRLLCATGRGREAEEQLQRAQRQVVGFNVTRDGVLQHATQVPLLGRARPEPGQWTPRFADGAIVCSAPCARCSFAGPQMTSASPKPASATVRRWCGRRIG